MDDDWYDVLRLWGWTAQPSKQSSKIYAKRMFNSKETGRRYLWLHRFIAGFPIDAAAHNKGGFRVSFKDGNTTNLRRENMSVLTPCRRFEYPCYGEAGKSKFVGVKWNSYNGVWEAHISNLKIMYCNTEIGAAMIYNFKAKEIMGRHAELNKFTFMSPEYQNFKPRRV